VTFRLMRQLSWTKNSGVERCLSTDVPVDADDVVAPQLFRVPRELVVVIPLRHRIADERRVRQREQVHDLPTHRVDHALRDDIAREAAGAAGVHVARQSAERTPDEAQLAGEVSRLGEVAVAFQRRRHGAAHEEGIGARQQIERIEKEQLVPVLVERQSGNNYGAAQRERRVVVAVPRLRTQRRRAARRVARPPPVPGVLGQGFVPLEVGRRPVELGAAALGHDDDVGAAGAAVFGLIVRGLNLDFGDRVERRGDVVGCAEPGVLAGDTVVRQPHELVAETIDLRTEERVPAGRVAHVRVDDPRHPLQQPQEIPAAELRVLDLVGPDRARAFAALRLRVQRRRLDRHDLFDAADFERHGCQRQALGCRHHDALLLVGPESGQRDSQVIRPRKHVREDEQPCVVGGGVTRRRGGGIAQRDGGARNGAFADVDHRSANLPGQALGARETRRADRQGQGQEGEDTLETFHVSSSALLPSGSTDFDGQPRSPPNPGCRLPGPS
jgi:hypothetical protein